MSLLAFDPPRHVIALSGGKDSTALALALHEREPRDYDYVITPTGNELPAMKVHWAKLERNAVAFRRCVNLPADRSAAFVRCEKTGVAKTLCKNSNRVIENKGQEKPGLGVAKSDVFGTGL